MKDLIISIILNFLNGVGYAIVAPILPVLIEAHNISETLAGIIQSAYSFSNLISIPLMPFILTKFNKRVLLIFSLLIETFSSIAFGLSKYVENEILFYTTCLLSRFLQGMAAGISVTILYSIASRSKDKDKVNRNIAFMETSANLGYAAGPVIASFITHHFDYSIAFYSIAALKAIFIIPAGFLTTVAIAESKISFLRALIKPRILLIFFLVVSDLSTACFYMPVFPSHLMNKFKMSLTTASFFLSIQATTYLILANFVPKIASVLGTYLCMALSCFCNMLFALFLPPSPFLPQYYYICIIGLIGFGLSEGLVTIISVDQFIKVLERDCGINDGSENDIGSAIYNLGVNLGDFIGPVIGGFTTEKLKFQGCCYFQSGQNLFFLILYGSISFKSILKDICCQNEDENIIDEDIEDKIEYEKVVPNEEINNAPKKKKKPRSEGLVISSINNKFKEENSDIINTTKSSENKRKSIGSIIKKDKKVIFE
ncbi:MAG: MFS transporter [archaeon]|nr:MFS transporter [archaeon]